MILTKEEALRAAQRADEYFSGTPHNAWGYGPMAVSPYPGSSYYNDPGECSLDDLREYG